MNNAKLYLSVAALWFASIFNTGAQILEFDSPVAMPEQVTTSASEESMPLLSKDGKTMYFVRTFHPDNSSGSDFGQDIWYSTKDDQGNWSEATNNLGALNTKTNNAIAGVSKDGKTVYLVNTYEGKKQSGVGLSKSTLKDGNWSTPAEVKIPGINPKGDFYGFYITPEEDVLLISMEDNFSKGKNDLYIAAKDAQGSWNVPANLGNINTPGNEISPFLSPDRKRLYFSTDGRGGMGGQDIFYSERQGDSWTDWGVPVNMSEGINSGDFDAYFSIYNDSTAFFCSSRNDTIANIYTTRISEPEVDEEEDDEDMITKDSETEDTEIDDSIEVVGTEGDNDINPREQIANNQAMDNIYYDYDKSFLREESKKALDVAIEELKKDPSLQVRLVGHCDHIGSQEYNLPLSQRRANAAREYMESQGIAGNRIDTEGKGKRQPAATNETPEGRQLNRRVEIYFK